MLYNTVKNSQTCVQFKYLVTSCSQNGSSNLFSATYFINLNLCTTHSVYAVTSIGAYEIPINR